MPYQPGQHAENMFFIPTGKICRRPPVFCAAGSTVREAAKIMQERNITCVVVSDEDRPSGIFTVRDLNRVTASCSGNPADLLLRDCMTPRLITLREDAYLFDAISLMSRHNFHRVGVVNDNGELVGVLTDTDLLSLQTRTPLYMLSEIERAESIEQLQRMNARLFEMINLVYQGGVEIRGVVQLIAYFNDAFTLRLIQLLEQNEGIALPPGVAYLSLGSEGRHEQTLRTDQDSALVYRDDFPPDQMPVLERFAGRLIDCLELLGVPRCPGNTMATNPQWRHSMTEWMSILETWISTPLQDNVVNFGMFQDMRVMHGELSFEAELRDHIYKTAHSMSLFFPSMARNIVRFKPPIGMFGRLLVEKNGPGRGKIDLKKGGLFAIVRGISLLALEVNIIGGSTWEKIERLRHTSLLSSKDLDEIEESFNTLMKMRLGRQLAARTANQEADNYVDPLVMLEKNRVQLRAALRGVETLLKIMRSHYQLDVIAR